MEVLESSSYILSDSFWYFLVKQLKIKDWGKITFGRNGLECNSVSQCVTVCHSVSQCVTMCHSVLRSFFVLSQQYYKAPNELPSSENRRYPKILPWHSG
jgi:hypothetical protein